MIKGLFTCVCPVTKFFGKIIIVILKLLELSLEFCKKMLKLSISNVFIFFFINCIKLRLIYGFCRYGLKVLNNFIYKLTFLELKVENSKMFERMRGILSKNLKRRLSIEVIIGLLFKCGEKLKFFFILKEIQKLIRTFRLKKSILKFKKVFLSKIIEKGIEGCILNVGISTIKAGGKNYKIPKLVTDLKGKHIVIKWFFNNVYDNYKNVEGNFSYLLKEQLLNIIFLPKILINKKLLFINEITTLMTNLRYKKR